MPTPFLNFSTVLSQIKKGFLMMFISASALSAAAQPEINLPAPSTTGGLSMMEALWNRHSDREFAPTMLSQQDLSDLLFAASGINRPESGKITAPSAMNMQEVDVYVFTTEGVYKYIPQGHKLEAVVAGDNRALIAGTPQFRQEFVLDAPISILLVANPQKFQRPSPRNLLMAMADAGIMTQNVCLFCAAKGLAAVPRASMDDDGLKTLLSLPEQAVPALNIPVGYPKADD